MSLPATVDSMRPKVLALEAQMREMPQVELRTEHHWADGMYCRVLAQKADTLIVGKVHKREHFFIVTTGRVQVVMDEGVRAIEAGTVLVSKPGTKRAILALEDSTYLTVHRTNKKNLAKIEKEIVEDDPLALFDARNEQRKLT